MTMNCLPLVLLITVGCSSAKPVPVAPAYTANKSDHAAADADEVRPSLEQGAAAKQDRVAPATEFDAVTIGADTGPMLAETSSSTRQEGSVGEALAQTDAGESTKTTAVASGTVRVTVTGFRNNKGRALVALFTHKNGFPNNAKRAAAKKAVTIRKGTAVVTFTNVPAGIFAVAVHHDENGDKKMNTSFMGIPQEGFGASRDPKSRFGPPSFDDSRLRLEPGVNAHLTIRLRYL